MTFFPLLLRPMTSPTDDCYSHDCDPQTMFVTMTGRKQARIKKGRNTSERWRGAAAGGLLGFPARDVRICCSVSGPELRGHAREEDDDSQHPAPPSSPPTAGHKNNQISYTAPAGQVLLSLLCTICYIGLYFKPRRLYKCLKYFLFFILFALISNQKTSLHHFLRANVLSSWRWSRRRPATLP